MTSLELRRGEIPGRPLSNKHFSGPQIRPCSGSEITSGFPIWSLHRNTLASASRRTGGYTVAVPLKETHPLHFVQAFGGVPFQFPM